MRTIFLTSLFAILTSCSSTVNERAALDSMKPYGVVELAVKNQQLNLQDSYFLAVDGKSVTRQNRLLLPPGKHVIKLGVILGSDVSGNSGIDIWRNRRSENTAVEFIVEEGYRYVLAARLEPKQRNDEWKAIVVGREKLASY